MPEPATSNSDSTVPPASRCPRCASDAISTLRIVYEEAVQRLRLNPTDPQARALSIQTAPPRPKPDKGAVARVIVSAGVLVAGIWAGIVLSNGHNISAPGGISPSLCIAVPGLLLLVLSLVQWTRTTTWNQKELPARVRAWADRRVCRSCGLSFVAPTAESSIRDRSHAPAQSVPADKP